MVDSQARPRSPGGTGTHPGYLAIATSARLPMTSASLPRGMYRCLCLGAALLHPPACTTRPASHHKTAFHHSPELAALILSASPFLALPYVGSARRSALR